MCVSVWLGERDKEEQGGRGQTEVEELGIRKGA
jgi:hypothetical protein